MYGLPKIHKEGGPPWAHQQQHRLGHILYNIAKYVSTILAPLVGKTPTHMQNSMDFVGKVRGLKLGPDETIL